MKKRTSIVFVVLFFVLLELAFRVYVVQNNHVERFFASARPLHSSNHIFAYPEKRIGWKLKKNIDGFYRGKRFVTNEHGFRDGPWNLKKDDGVYRIAVLGRSYSMGTGVSEGENWTDLIETKLNQKRKTEVLNFSVEGYSWVQIEAVYHRIVRNFAPDMIIFPIFYEEMDRPVPIEARTPPSFFQKYSHVNGWLGHLYLPQVVNYYNWKYFKQYTFNDWTKLDTGLAPKVEFTTVSHVLQRLLLETKKQNQHVLLVNMPRLYVEQTERDRIGKKRFTLLAKGASHVDIVHDDDPLYEDFDYEDTGVIGDPHPDAMMHQRIAEHVNKSFPQIK